MDNSFWEIFSSLLSNQNNQTSTSQNNDGNIQNTNNENFNNNFSENFSRISSSYPEEIFTDKSKEQLKNQNSYQEHFNDHKNLFAQSENSQKNNTSSPFLFNNNFNSLNNQNLMPLLLSMLGGNTTNTLSQKNLLSMINSLQSLSSNSTKQKDSLTKSEAEINDEIIF